MKEGASSEKGRKTEWSPGWKETTNLNFTHDHYLFVVILWHVLPYIHCLNSLVKSYWDTKAFLFCRKKEN